MVKTSTTSQIIYCTHTNPVFAGDPETWNFKNFNCISTSTTVNGSTSSTAPLIYNGYTYGEIIISLFLFLIFMVGIFSLLWFGIIKPHIHKIHQKP